MNFFKGDNKKMKKNNILSTILYVALASLAITATVSLVKNINKPGDDPTISVPDVETRKNLTTFNFVTTTDNKDLSGETTLINFLNGCNEDSKQVFGTLLTTSNEKTVPYAIKLYQSKELGLRLDSSSAVGGFGINMAEDFTFNRAKVKAVNYHRLKTIAEEDGTFNYNKQTNGSSYTLNEKAASLPMKEDLKIADDVIESTFEFETAQTTLTIAGTSGRPCLLSLELWTE